MDYSKHSLHTELFSLLSSLFICKRTCCLFQMVHVEQRVCSYSSSWSVSQTVLSHCRSPRSNHRTHDTYFRLIIVNTKYSYLHSTLSYIKKWWMDGWIDGCVCAPSCPSLCDPMDCSPPGSFVHGIYQQRILEWVAISFSKGVSWPGDCTNTSCIFCIGGHIVYHWATWEAKRYDTSQLLADFP